MAGVQLTGLASGMDTSSIIEQTMEVERQPLYNRASQKETYQSEKEAWQDIDSKMTSMRSASNDLKYSSTFGAMSVESSETTVATATADNNSAETTYILEDVIMATAGQMSSSTSVNLSDGLSANVEGTSTVTDKNQRFSAGTSVVAGTFKINDKLIEVEEDDTLSLVINKINASGANIEASFDEATNTFKLETLNSSSSYDIEFDSSDTSGFLAAVGLGDKVGTTVDNGVSEDYQRTIAEIKADETTNTESPILKMDSGFFTVNGYTFEVDEEEDTIKTIVDKINSAEAGVVAFYDNDSKKMTLTAGDAGEDVVVENDTSGFLTAMNLMKTEENIGSGDGTINEYTMTDIPATTSDMEIKVGDTVYSGEDIITSGDPAAGQVLVDLGTGNIKFGTTPEAAKEITVSYNSEKMTYEGTGSSLKINGILFEKESNSFEVNGVNIELNSNTEDGERVTLKVANDTEKSYEKIEAFISKYNELIESIESKTQLEGVLQGDSSANNLKYGLRSQLTSPVTGVNSGYNSLAMLGITAEDNISAKLTLDSSILKEALADDPDAVEKLFTQAAGITEMMDETVGTGDGTETVFGLDKVPDSLEDMSITVGGVTYTEEGTYELISSGTPITNQILVNTSTGQITFGVEPDEGALITATYNYEDANSGGGIAERSTNYITPYTQYSGTLDTKTESLDNRMEDIDDWIESQQRILELREESLRRQYTAMEQAIQESNSTGSWLSQQSASL